MHASRRFAFTVIVPSVLGAIMAAVFIPRDTAGSLSAVSSTVSTSCGNGYVDVAEECDDGNRDDGDGCNEACLLEKGRCGDQIVQKALGEQCEPFTHGRECTTRCVWK